MAPNRTTLECFLLVVWLLCLGVFHSVFCMLGCCLWQVRFGWNQGALEISLSTHVSRPLGWRVFVLRFSVDSRFNFQNSALILKHFCTIRASVSFVCVLFLFFWFRVDRTKRTAWFGLACIWQILFDNRRFYNLLFYALALRCGGAARVRPTRVLEFN